MISLSASRISLPKNKNAVVSINQKRTDAATTDGHVIMTGTSRVILPAVRRIPAERVDPRVDMIITTITDSETTIDPAITGTGSITAAVTKGVGKTTAAMTDSGTITARNALNLAPIRGTETNLPKTDDGTSPTCSVSRSSRSRCCWCFP